MKELVFQHGAVATDLLGHVKSFQSYQQGIYHGCPPGLKTSHEVTIVGFVTEAGQDFWLGKNSWGPGWGEKGFFR